MDQILHKQLHFSIKSTRILLSICILLASISHRAWGETKEMWDKDLSEVLDLDVSVASLKKMSAREAPGVLTVWTKEDIINSGARDLIDIFHLIPGLHIFGDVQGVSLLGIRGQHDRILLLWNGHQMQELLYLTTQFGNHFPVEEIERIEIIRGPGSVLYGGSAALGVINIITKDAKTLNGAETSSTVGVTAHALSRYSGDIQVGKEYENVGIRASVYKSDAIRSDKDYTDFAGDSFNMANYSDTGSQFYSTDIRIYDFKFHFLGDNYHLRQRNEFGYNLPDDAINNFDRYSYIAEYTAKPLEGLSITPMFTYIEQKPWNEKPLENFDNFVFSQKIKRYQADLVSLYEANDVWSFTLGGQWYYDEAHDNLGEGYYGPSDNIHLTNTAGFGELEAKTSLANIRFGVRYDHPEQFESHWIPRLAITKAYEKSYVKLLASSSFKAPSIQNYSLTEIGRQTDPSIKPIQPEEVTVYEAEVGHAVTDHLNGSLTLFHIKSASPITYRYDPETETESYYNDNALRTQGLESTMRWSDTWGFTELAYSRYDAVDSDGVESIVGDHSSWVTGFAKNKFSARASFKYSEELRINPTYVVYGGRYANTTVDEVGNEVKTKLRPEAMGNLHFLYQPQEIKNLSIDFGINNIFNSDWLMVGSAAPQPTLSREYMVRVTYKFSPEFSS